MSEAIATAVSRLHHGQPDPFDAAIYEASLALVRLAVERLGWGTMGYQCESCPFHWRIWLSLGVEGPPELRDSGLYLASPFTVPCPAWPAMKPCGGTMRHVRFHDDQEFSPRLIPDDAPRFVLPYSAQRGDSGSRLEIPGPALLAARKALNEEPS